MMKTATFLLAALLAGTALSGASIVVRGPILSPVTVVLPSASAAWFADDWTGTVLTEFIGGGAGTMNDINGVVYLPYVAADGAWVYCPDAGSANSVTTPYHSSFNITGDNELHLKAWIQDWTPGANRFPFVRGDDVSANYQWHLRLKSATTGALMVLKSSGANNISSSAANTITDGATSWLRWRMDTGTDTQFGTGSNGTSWTALGTAQADIGTATSNTSYGIRIGAATATTGQWQGGIYQVRWYSGLVGSSPTQVVDFNAADFTGNNYNTCVDSLGRTYTVNRSTSGLQFEVVDRSMFMGDGTNDYLTVAHHAAFDLGTGSWSVSILCRIENVSASRALFANKSGTGQGFMCLISGASITGNASDGTDDITTAGSTVTLGANVLVSLIRDGNTLYVALDGVRGTGSDVTAVGSVTNADALNVLALNTAGSYADGVAFMGLAIHKTSALTAGQCATLKTEMLAQTTH